MAQSHSHRQRVESITDLTHDLDLLFPNGYGPVSSIVEGTQMRQTKIQELKRTRGTVQQVGLSVTVANWRSMETTFHFFVFKTCRSVKTKSICRVITATRDRQIYKKKTYVALIVRSF